MKDLARCCVSCLRVFGWQREPGTGECDRSTFDPDYCDDCDKVLTGIEYLQEQEQDHHTHKECTA